MNSYDKIMWGKIIIPCQEVLIDLPETPDEPFSKFFSNWCKENAKLRRVLQEDRESYESFPRNQS